MNDIESVPFLGMALKDWSWLIGGALAMATFMKGIAEFIKSNRLKRAEFLEKLVIEFNNQNTLLARKILDDFTFEVNGKEEWTDEQILKQGKNKEIENAYLVKQLKDLMRDHNDREVVGHGELRARQSFDFLLEFFAKLEYFLNLDLIRKEELRFFQYYIDHCAKKAGGDVMRFAVRYDYHSLLRLIYVLNIEPGNKVFFEHNLKWDSDKQKNKYNCLRNK